MENESGKTAERRGKGKSIYVSDEAYEKVKALAKEGLRTIPMQVNHIINTFDDLSKKAKAAGMSEQPGPGFFTSIVQKAASEINQKVGRR